MVLTELEDVKDTSWLYFSYVMTGLLATLTKRGISCLTMRGHRIDYALEQSFPLIQVLAKEQGLRPIFRIRRHFIHGDSQAVQEEIVKAVGRNIACFSNPPDGYLYIKIHPENADLFLDRLPLTQENYERIASEFLNHYREFV